MPVNTNPTIQEMVRTLHTLASDQRGFRRLMTVHRPRLLPTERLLPLIPLHASVYDIGCGGGVLLSLIAQYRQPTKLGGFDIAPGAVATAQQLVRRAAHTGVPIEINLTTADTPMQLGGYRYITVIDVLHHLPPAILESWISQLYAAMENGAQVIIKDIDGSSPWHLANKLHDLVVARQVSHEPGAMQVESILSRIGFHIEQRGNARVLWYPHFWIVARKPDSPQAQNAPTNDAEKTC